MTKENHPREAGDIIQSIDDQIKTATGGASDLYGLLATLASQTLGIPRAAFTPPKPSEAQSPGLTGGSRLEPPEDRPAEPQPARWGE